MGTRLNDLYVRKLLPAEGFYNFRDFHSPPLDNAYFQAKPMVLLLGEYSVGKTSFIKYLLERSFPAMQIGPEPTTDKFHIVTYGDFDKVIPGNALVVDPSKPFRHLDTFGSPLLNRLQCSTVRSEVLKSITLVDTPGILANVDRGYDFAQVLKWFADRADMIILLCDPLKLDISDELKRCMDTIAHCEDRIKIVFNKADQINYQDLMRTYGALMWNLGLVLNHPETPRVYVGTFWDNSFFYDDNRMLFEAEKDDLYNDLANLPRQALINKMDSMLERVKTVFIHTLIVGRIKEQLKSVIIGKSFKRNEIVNNLHKTFQHIQEKYKVTEGDFPDVEQFQSQLAKVDIRKFHSVKNSILDQVLKLWKEDLPAIMKEMNEKGIYDKTTQKVAGGVFDKLNEMDLTPFGDRPERALDVTVFEEKWPPQETKNKRAKEFQKIATAHGKLSGSQAKTSLLKTKLPRSILARIWNLSDVDSDGMLDEDEFAIAHYLAEQCLQGLSLPPRLPSHLFPPKYKDLYSPEISLDESNASETSGFSFDADSSFKRRAPKSPFDRSLSVDSGIFPVESPENPTPNHQGSSPFPYANAASPNKRPATVIGSGDAPESTPSIASDSGISTPNSNMPDQPDNADNDANDAGELGAVGGASEMRDAPGAIAGSPEIESPETFLGFESNVDTKSLHSSSSRALDSIAEEDEEEEEEEEAPSLREQT